MTDRDPFERASELGLRPPDLRGAQGSSEPIDSSVVIEFEEGAVPIAQANARAFFVDLAESLHAEPSNAMAVALDKLSADLSSITLRQLDQYLPVRITFEDGSISYTDNGRTKNIQIPSITLAGRRLTIFRASALGTSDDAMKALEKVYECVCRAASTASQWTQAQAGIVARGFSTTSTEQFDGGLENLLSGPLWGFLRDGIPTFSKTIGTFPLDQTTGQPMDREYLVVTKLEVLELSVTRFDPSSGDSQETSIAIAPRSTVDVGFSAYRVRTPLPYDEHVRFVTQLKTALGNSRTGQAGVE